MRTPTLVGAVLLLAAFSSAQLAWRLRTPANSPPARVEAGLAFDGQGVMLFGGTTWGTPVNLFGDTWRWDGQNWTNLRPTNAPSPRAWPAIAYDPVRQRVILFGGWDANNPSYRDDMWEWDGQNWREVFPSPRPPRLAAPQMVYDPVRQRIVLLGFVSNLETWEWDGSGWIQTSPVPGPGTACNLSYDSVLMRPLMVTARNHGGQQWFMETWSYAIGTWHQYGPPSSPSPRARAAMAFDQARRRVTLFGGGIINGIGPTNETWEWDGGGWQQLSLGNAPTVRMSPAMAYDPIRRGFVAFGGQQDSARFLNDTWELANPDLGDFARFGTGCPGSVGTPALDSVPSGSFPNIGEGFALRLTSLPVGRPAFLYLGFSRATWNGLALPLDLAPVGAPGCPLLVSPDFILSLANLGGIAPVTLPIPSDAGLLGIRLFVQGWASDPGANQLGIVVSNAGEGLIGRR